MRPGYNVVSIWMGCGAWCFGASVLENAFVLVYEQKAGVLPLTWLTEFVNYLIPYNYKISKNSTMNLFTNAIEMNSLLGEHHRQMPCALISIAAEACSRVSGVSGVTLQPQQDTATDRPRNIPIWDKWC